MSVLINADTSDGLKFTSDTSGEIKLQSAGVDIATIDSSGITMASGKVLAPTGPAFSAYLSSNQSVTGGVSTKVAFDVEQFDTNSNYDNTTNYRFTPSVEGYYQVNVSLLVDLAGRGFVRLYKNGDIELNMGDIDSTDTRVVNGSALVYMNGSTDYLEVYGFRGTTGNINGGLANENQFSAFLARAV